MQDAFDLNLWLISAQAWLRLLRTLAFCSLIGFLIFVGFRNFSQSDPYIQAVINAEGSASHGASLFALNCAACHGEEGNGKVGPSLRGVHTRRSDRFLIEQVTSGNTPPMPQFQPDPQEMADLISYLKSL